MILKYVEGKKKRKERKGDKSLLRGIEVGNDKNSNTYITGISTPVPFMQF